MKQYAIFALVFALFLSLSSCHCSKKAQSSKTDDKKTESAQKPQTQPAKTAGSSASSQASTTPATSQADIDKQLILDYLKTNKIKDYKITASGVYCVIEKEGSKEKPNINSKVNCHYRGTLLNGTEFDSSYKRNQPIEFPLTGVIKGWQEGIPTIGTGGKVKLLIPSGLAYGKQNMGVITPNSVLIFDVELLDFK